MTPGQAASCQRAAEFAKPHPRATTHRSPHAQEFGAKPAIGRRRRTCAVMGADCALSGSIGYSLLTFLSPPIQAAHRAPSQPKDRSLTKLIRKPIARGRDVRRRLPGAGADQRPRCRLGRRQAGIFLTRDVGFVDPAGSARQEKGRHQSQICAANRRDRDRKRAGHAVTATGAASPGKRRPPRAGQFQKTAQGARSWLNLL